MDVCRSDKKGREGVNWVEKKGSDKLLGRANFELQNKTSTQDWPKHTRDTLFWRGYKNWTRRTWVDGRVSNGPMGVRRYT